MFLVFTPRGLVNVFYLWRNFGLQNSEKGLREVSSWKLQGSVILICCQRRLRGVTNYEHFNYLHSSIRQDENLENDR